MRFRFQFFLCLCTMLGVACATDRKISQVGLREPSSLGAGEAKEEISTARMRLANLQELPRTCPANLSNRIVQLSMQKVIQARCPETLSMNLQSSLKSLLMEERSLLEEVEGAQCQSLIHSQQDETIFSFLENFDNTGPVGRHRHVVESVQSEQDDFESLNRLKENLREIVLVNFPVERWTLHHGKFVLPEDEVDFLFSLVSKQACRMNDSDFDRLYKLQQVMEEFSRIVVQEKQRQDLQQFLESLHLITDSKMKEFFYSR